MGNLTSMLGASALAAFKDEKIASLMIEIDGVWMDQKEQNPYVREFLTGQKMDGYIQWQKQKELHAFQQQMKEKRATTTEECGKLEIQLKSAIENKTITDSQIDQYMHARRKVVIIDKIVEEWEEREWKPRELCFQVVWKQIYVSTPVNPSLITKMVSLLQSILQEARLAKQKGMPAKDFMQSDILKKLQWSPSTSAIHVSSAVDAK